MYDPGDSGAEERFKAISEAYEVLSDAQQRKKYDQVLATSAIHGNMPERPGCLRVGRVPVELNGGNNGAE